MGEIPEDVMTAAIACWNSRAGRGPVVEDIARAILAERERCADAVHCAAKDFYGNTDQMYASALIVSAIESGQ